MPSSTPSTIAELENRLGTEKFTFTLADAKVDKQNTSLDVRFVVVRFKGYEALGRPYRYEITVVSDRANLDASKLLHKRATFAFVRGSGASDTAKRFGVIAEFEVLKQDSGFTFFNVVLVPALEMLSFYRYDVFYLNKTLPDLIDQLLVTDGGMSAATDLNRSGLTGRPNQGGYPSMPFVCQYRESHLDFLSRLLERFGAYYYFEPTGDREKVVFVDKSSDLRHLPAASPPSSGAPAAFPIPYGPGSGGSTSVMGDRISAFICRTKPMPAKVVVRNFDEENAGLNLTAESPVQSGGKGEVDIYGENVSSQTDSNWIAGLRADELKCRATQYVGEGTSIHMSPGWRFQLQSHFVSDFNRSYLIAEVEHEGSQASVLLAGFPNALQPSESALSHVCRFTALPDDAPFRPERITRPPRFDGVLNATISSESTGQYADVDTQGRYLVKLPFDRRGANAVATHRIRMATPYGGFRSSADAVGNTAPAFSSANYGMHFPILKGSNVLLSFVNGDMDRPVIAAVMPDSVNTNVLGTVTQKTNVILTPGGNRLEMHDDAAQQRMLLVAPYPPPEAGVTAPPFPPLATPPNTTATPAQPSAHYPTYLRLGHPLINDPHAQRPNPLPASWKPTDDYAYFLYTKGKGKQYFEGGFESYTGAPPGALPFGENLWEVRLGWAVADGPDMNEDADKELNFTNNVTHTRADNVERTFGNSWSTTIGSSSEYTMGSSESQVIGDSTEWVCGTSESYIGYPLSSVPTISRGADPSGAQDTLPASASALPNLKNTVPRIGQSDWEKDYSWGKPSGWTQERFNKAAKEVNWLDSVTHSKGDTYERVKGDSDSETRGNSKEVVYGNSESEVHGNVKDRHFGNVDEHHYGRSDSMHLGGSAELFVGGKAEVTAATSAELTLALLALEIYLGTTFEFNLGAKIELKGANEFKIKAGTTFGQKLLAVGVSVVSLGNAAAKIENGFELKT